MVYALVENHNGLMAAAMVTHAYGELAVPNQIRSPANRAMQCSLNQARLRERLPEATQCSLNTAQIALPKTNFIGDRVRFLTGSTASSSNSTS
jgi:hypothetical protein